MPEGFHREVICKGFCAFYSPGKTSGLRCGSYDLLAGSLSRRELSDAARMSPPRPDFSMDREIRDIACVRCGFLDGGCDFREGLASPPCGGYAIVEGLLKRAHA